MEEDIKRLLSAWNYQQALQFYAAHGPSGYKQKLFAQGESVFNAKLLREWLEETLQKHQAGPKHQQAPAIPQREEAHLPIVKKMPAQVAEIEARKQRLFRRTSALKAQLYQLHQEGNERELTSACQEIIENWTAIYQCWWQLDHWRAHGEVPKLPTEQEVDYKSLSPITLAKRLESLKRTVRKYKKEVKESSGEAQLYAQAKLEEYEKELQKVILALE